MPWQETNPVLERHHFAQDYASGHWRMAELCLRYGISRNTGYKWLERYRQRWDERFVALDQVVEELTRQEKSDERRKRQ